LLKFSKNSRKASEHYLPSEGGYYLEKRRSIYSAGIVLSKVKTSEPTDQSNSPLAGPPGQEYNFSAPV
jgi:hypothetical protein